MAWVVKCNTYRKNQYVLRGAWGPINAYRIPTGAAHAPDLPTTDLAAQRPLQPPSLHTHSPSFLLTVPRMIARKVGVPFACEIDWHVLAGSRRPALRRQDSGPTFDPQPSPCMTSHNVSERARSRLLSLFVGLTHYKRMIRSYAVRSA
jgi:hypothetical protein